MSRKKEDPDLDEKRLYNEKMGMAVGGDEDEK